MACVIFPGKKKYLLLADPADPDVVSLRGCLRDLFVLVPYTKPADPNGHALALAIDGVFRDWTACVPLYTVCTLESKQN